MSSKKYLVIVIQGGLGKCVVATAAIRSLKKQYPDKKIVVVSGWSEVFDDNPHVHRTFRFNENKYLYEEYIKDGTLLSANPYDLDEYRDGQIHLAEAFCKVWGCEFDGGVKPELYIDKVLDEITKKEIMMLRLDNKPVIVIQYIGRTFKDKETGVLLPSGRESLELYEKVMNKIADKYTLVVMKTSQEPVLNCPKARVLAKDIHFKKWFGYIKNADGFIGVDSSGQHIAAAFEKPSVVTWGRTNPINLGYPWNSNIQGQCEDGPCNGFLSFPVFWKCPYDFKCAKNIDEEKFLNEIENKFKDIKPVQVPPELRKQLLAQMQQNQQPPVCSVPQNKPMILPQK